MIMIYLKIIEIRHLNENEHFTEIYTDSFGNVLIGKMRNYWNTSR